MLKTILVILPLACLVLVLMLILRNNSVPENLGVRKGRLAPLPTSPNAVSSQTDDTGRQVAPLPFIGDLRQTTEALLQAINNYPGRVQIVSRTRTYIHCVFSTARMRFKDDVEFSLDAGNKVVHFRSASRLGYSDMGLNRRRYDKLASLYLHRT